MKENLINAYKNLSLNDKRNEYNAEIILIYNIIEAYLNMNNKKSHHIPYNYDSVKDLNKSEDELLTIAYSDLIEIKNNLLLFLALNDEKLNNR